MSLENNLERIAVALEKIAENAKPGNVIDLPGNTSQQEAPAQKEPETPAPAKEKEEVKPTSPFDQPAPDATVNTYTAEFTDNAGLVAYAMRAYTEVGAERGARIQGALGALGYTNINDVKPEHFQGFFDAVEAIKRGE